MATPPNVRQPASGIQGLNKHRTTAVVIGKGGTFATCCRRLGAHSVSGRSAPRNRCCKPSAPPGPAARRLRGCRAWRGAARRGAVLLPCAPARRARSGAPLPAPAHRADLNRQIDPGGVFDLTMPSAFASLRTWRWSLADSYLRIGIGGSTTIRSLRVGGWSFSGSFPLP
jgi:hypothetical protein